MPTLTENIQQLEGTKSRLKTSIEGKGIVIPNGSKLDTYPGYIGKIITGGELSDKISLKDTGMRIAYSTWTEVPAIIDFAGMTDYSRLFFSNINITASPQLDANGVTSFNEMFRNCDRLEEPRIINTGDCVDMSHMFTSCDRLYTIPLLDTSNVRDMSGMFFGCTNLSRIPLLDTSKVEDMSQMFLDCAALTEIPNLNTISAKKMNSIFNGCHRLTTIPKLDTSKVEEAISMFYRCYSLKSIPNLDFSSVTNIFHFFNDGFSENNLEQLTDIGGFTNLKIDWNDDGGLCYCPNLKKESIINILNGLYDFRGNGDMNTTRTIRLHQNSKAILSDSEKAIATAKGWKIVA